MQPKVDIDETFAKVKEINVLPFIDETLKLQHDKIHNLAIQMR